MKYAQAPRAVSDSMRRLLFDRFGWQMGKSRKSCSPSWIEHLFWKVKIVDVPNVDLQDRESLLLQYPPLTKSDVKLLKQYAANRLLKQRKDCNFWQMV